MTNDTNQNDKLAETKKSEEGIIEYIGLSIMLSLIICVAILTFSKDKSDLIINLVQNYWTHFICVIAGGFIVLSDGNMLQKSIRGAKVTAGLVVAFSIVFGVIATK